MKAQLHHVKAGGMGAMWILLLAMAMLTSCQRESRGFVLPEGDIEEGKQAFLELNCNRCHSVGDIAWIGDEKWNDPHVKLGGEVTVLNTYGELVTAVINPSHEITQPSLNAEKLTLAEGTSKMNLYRYNEIMTVEELIDIVTFLQSEYELVVPTNTYPYHGF